MATGVPAATVTGVRVAKASVAKAIVARVVTATGARAAKVVSAADDRHAPRKPRFEDTDNEPKNNEPDVF